MDKLLSGAMESISPSLFLPSLQGVLLQGLNFNTYSLGEGQSWGLQHCLSRAPVLLSRLNSALQSGKFFSSPLLAQGQSLPPEMMLGAMHRPRCGCGAGEGPPYCVPISSSPLNSRAQRAA